MSYELMEFMRSREKMKDEEKWVVVGKPNCIWCFKTMAALDAAGIEFEYIEAKGDLRDFLKLNNLFTVPQVWVNGHHIGGHEDVVKVLEKED